MGCGIIVSESQPLPTNRYTWLKPSTGELFEQLNGDSWQLIGQLITTPHASSHEDGGDDRVNQLGTIHLKGKVYVGSGDDDQGQTLEIVLAEGTLTVKKGVIVAWSPS